MMWQLDLFLLPGCSTWTHGICNQQVAPCSYDVMIDVTTYFRNCCHIYLDDTNQLYEKSIEHIDPEPTPNVQFSTGWLPRAL